MVIEPNVNRFKKDCSMFSNVRVLCVGDVMLDTFVYGGVDRLSPEAPVPILSHKESIQMCGGAGNVAANMAALGAGVTLIGVVGEDKDAERLKSLMGPNIETHFIACHDRPTTHKTRFISQGKHLLRVDNEKAAPLTELTEDKVINAIEQALHEKTYHIIVVSDYAKGVVSPRVCQTLLESGMPVFVDPKGFDYRPYQGVTLISPNLKELIAATPAGTLQERVEFLMDSLKVSYVLLTQGAEGMTLFQKGADPFHVSATAHEVFDVSGAGDTVMSTLAVAFSSGASIQDAVVLANRAAGIVVSKVGTSVISADQLDGRLPNLPWQDQIARWKQKGDIIGFTNGCFDCLHTGHLHLLRQARKSCQRLVVGLNSDASVRRLKGETRPLQTEDVRATILEALPEVDLVVLFDEDTPLGLIQAMMPDVLIKGADYTVDKVVGADVVKQNGGRVVLAELLRGYSTTKMTQRMERLAP